MALCTSMHGWDLCSLHGSLLQVAPDEGQKKTTTVAYKQPQFSGSNLHICPDETHTCNGTQNGRTLQCQAVPQCDTMHAHGDVTHAAVSAVLALMDPLVWQLRCKKPTDGPLERLALLLLRVLLMICRQVAHMHTPPDK